METERPKILATSCCLYFVLSLSLSLSHPSALSLSLSQQLIQITKDIGGSVNENKPRTEKHSLQFCEKYLRLIYF